MIHFSFCQSLFNRRLLPMRQNESASGKGLIDRLYTMKHFCILIWFLLVIAILIDWPV